MTQCIIDAERVTNEETYDKVQLYRVSQTRVILGH